MWRRAARRGRQPLRRVLWGEGGGLGGRHHQPARTATTTTTSAAPQVGGGGRKDAGGVEVPRDADVVVVGGGVVGCSVLYHLAKLGVTNTVLLEAHQLTAGTTWHTAGLIYRMGKYETDFLLQETTRQVTLRLEEETGVNPGFIQNGSLCISSNKSQPDQRKGYFGRWATFLRGMGVESHVLGPAEVKDIYPLMDTSDVNCALYSPTSGQVDPAGLCQGLTRWAARAGARVVQGCPVTDIKTEETLLGGRRVTEVHTPRGVIKTNAVVNATGGWANNIASKVGLTVPVQSFKHGYVVTERIEGVQGMPNVRDFCASCYLKMQGDALLIGCFEGNPVPLEKLGLDFPFGLYEMDWTVFGPILEHAMKRIPALQKTGIKSTILGPESFTPDNRPIVGEDPDVQGFFHCCGFNSHGMQLSGGIGDQMAKWVVRGLPEYDMFYFDIRRFHPPLVRNKDWVLQRSQEGLSRNYSIIFPHDEPFAGRRQRLSPLHQELEAAGCMFQERHGWERPGWFHSAPAPVLPYDWYGAYDHTAKHPEYLYEELLTNDYSFDFPVHHHVLQKECEACRERVAVFDMTAFGKFYVTGPDAQKVVDWVCSADMARPPGTTVYTCMLNANGGVEGDLTVSVCEGGAGAPYDPAFEGRGFYFTTGSSTVQYCKAHVVKAARARGWRVSVLDHTEDLALLSVQGPRSRALLQQLTQDDLGDLAFPFSSHKVITVAGHTLRALRLSFVGELGWELHVPRASAVAVYRAVVAAGQEWGLANAGFRAMDSLSSEKGYRHWHSDVRPDDTPLEAGLAFTCKLNTQTDFQGRAALEQQRAEGVTKRLVTVTHEGEARALWGLETLLRDGRVVGYLRRADYGFTLGRTIGYGYVQQPEGGAVTQEFLSRGDWQLEVMGERLPATVHLRPLFDPKNLRMKGVYEKGQGGPQETSA